MLEELERMVLDWFALKTYCSHSNSPEFFFILKIPKNKKVSLNLFNRCLESH